MAYTGSRPKTTNSNEFDLGTDEITMNTSPNGVYHIQLNRPKQLNAFNLNMSGGMFSALNQIRNYDPCKAILLTGKGDKAFCAGGDVRSITQFVPESAKFFFGSEYQVDYMTSLIKKPHISVWKGIVMGGGVGLSIRSHFRICTDNSIFAMPETMIGLFPDVGVSYELCRLKDGVGLYTGLTSQRLNSHDLMTLGLATHYIPLENVEKFIAELKATHFDTNKSSFEVVGSLIEKFADGQTPSTEPNLSTEKLSKIKKYFSQATTLNNLIELLKKDKEDSFCSETLETLQDRCPTSCAVFFKEYHMATRMTLKDVLKLDYKISQSFAYNPNFKEGVRARLIDKDNNPSWTPKTFEEIDDKEIDSLIECSWGESLDILDQIE